MATTDDEVGNAGDNDELATIDNDDDEGDGAEGIICCDWLLLDILTEDNEFADVI